jgi:hypothetical protein
LTTTNEIIGLVKDYSGRKNITDNTDIFNAGIVGDDFHELIEKYAKTYSVEMTNYLWYFHADEEGCNIGGIFFEPPYKRVERIPVTPSLLTEFANKGKWDIDYPKHKIPQKRYDLLINKVSFIVFIVCLIIFTFKKC